VNATQNVSTKRCSTCKKAKPLAEFRRRSDRPDGRRARCKLCSKPFEQKYYQSKAPGISAKNRALRQSNPSPSKRHRVQIDCFVSDLLDRGVTRSREIIAELNAAGLKPFRAEQWHHSTIRAIRKRIGREPGRSYFLADSERAAIIAGFGSGQSLREMAAQLGRDESTVRAVLSNAGVSVSERNKELAAIERRYRKVMQGVESKRRQQRKLVSKIDERTNIDPDTNSRFWTGAVDKEGYPVIYTDGRQQFAHRLIEVLAHGPLKPGEVVHHVTRDKRCISHLLRLPSDSAHKELHRAEDAIVAAWNNGTFRRELDAFAAQDDGNWPGWPTHDSTGIGSRVASWGPGTNQETQGGRRE
jgi:hypothetical protein